MGWYVFYCFSIGLHVNRLQELLLKFMFGTMTKRNIILEQLRKKTNIKTNLELFGMMLRKEKNGLILKKTTTQLVSILLFLLPFLFPFLLLFFLSSVILLFFFSCSSCVSSLFFFSFSSLFFFFLNFD